MLPASMLLAAALYAPAAELTVRPTDWPQFRGLNRDAISPEKGLLQKWPEKGPPKLWTAKDLGGGYSTVAVVGGFVFGTGKKGDKEHVWKLKETDGSEVWSVPFADFKKVGYEEGTRSTPTYAKGKVYAVSMGGELACVDADKGTVVWKKSYTKDFGGSVQAWGYSESVLVDDGKVICTPGSATAAVVALKADTGDVVWKTPVTKPGGANGYASAVKAEVGGIPMYINLLGKDGGVVGVNAKTGKLLWQYNKIMNGTANIPSVVVKDDLVFCSTGYGDGGAALLKLKADKGGVTATEVKYYKANELQNHHGGMVAVGDYIYFGNAHNQGKPVCVEFKTGDIKWKEDNSPARAEGSAAVAYADGMLYFRYQNGKMVLIKADPKEFSFVSAFDLPEKSNKPSWPHPTIADGKLFIRDQDKLHCFNIKDAAN